jgi:phage terminase Nu1 subunit (DNA packaging protein)
MELTQKQLASLAGLSIARLQQINQSLPETQKLFVKGEKEYKANVFVQQLCAYKYAAGQEKAQRNLTQQDMADLVDMSLRRLQQIDSKLPEGEKLFVKKDGQTDAATFFQNWVAYSVSCAIEESGKLDLDQVRAQHELKKMEKTELNLLIQRGQLVNAEDVRALWGDIVTTVRHRMLSIPTSLAPRLTMLEDKTEIQAIISREIRAALEMIAKCRLPQAAVADEESEDAEE